MNFRFKKSVVNLGCLLLLGCVNQNCREVQVADDAKNPAKAKATTEAEVLNAPQNRIKIYKYDGSLQCGMGEAVALDVMQQDLKNIHVFSSEKKADGLMHIQACGTPTGMANIFEVDKKDLPEAKKLGFKDWLF